jgi:hypothetical protein
MNRKARIFMAKVDITKLLEIILGTKKNKDTDSNSRRKGYCNYSRYIVKLEPDQDHFKGTFSRKSLGDYRFNL